MDKKVSKCNFLMKALEADSSCQVYIFNIPCVCKHSAKFQRSALKTWRIWLHKKKYCLLKMLFKKPKVSEYGKKFWNGSIIFNMYVHISNVSKICIKNFVHYIKQIHVGTICWKFQILEVIISIKNIIFIKK